jgi:DNA-binding CsgD family transcriptional regulator
MREGIVKPLGLLVDRFEIGDDELALFEWDVAEADVKLARSVLTPAERSVLELLVSGASNARIAQVRGASVRTVANQVASVLKKLRASSRFELVRRYGRSDANGRTT